MSYTVFLPHVQGGAPEPIGLAAQVLVLVNAVRGEAGLSGLRHNAGLARAAQLHAEDMRDQDYFSHDSLDRPWYVRVAEHYPDWQTLGEVIGAQAATAAAIVQAWMDSEPHRAIILSEKFEDAGVGYAEGGGRYGNYYVVDFGRRN